MWKYSMWVKVHPVDPLCSVIDILWLIWHLLLKDTETRRYHSFWDSAFWESPLRLTWHFSLFMFCLLILLNPPPAPPHTHPHTKISPPTLTTNLCSAGTLHQKSSQLLSHFLRALYLQSWRCALNSKQLDILTSHTQWLANPVSLVPGSISANKMLIALAIDNWRLATTGNRAA